ncbi:MAG TPA: hypothetical protein V6D28_21275 [Leptolyngbyaceae cyanobacterium]
MNKKIITYGLAGLLASAAVVAVAITRAAKMPPQNNVESESGQIKTIDHHAGHSMSNAEMPSNSISDSAHGEHTHHRDRHSAENNDISSAKLSVTSKIEPNQPVKFVIDIKDTNGKAIAKFDRFQESLMHLIIVSDDLRFFTHLHPTYQQNGRFEVTAKLPQTGGYTIFSDYKPSGQTEQVSVLKTQIPGHNPPTPTIDVNTAKTFGDTKINLTFSEPNLKAGKPVSLTFNLQDSKNRSITDLKPYLGERGHLVIIKQSSPLTKADYIHAHAGKNSPTGQVKFMTNFPRSGKYKLWGQFNRNGKIVTADFWVNVN